MTGGHYWSGKPVAVQSRHLHLFIPVIVFIVAVVEKANMHKFF